MTLFGALFLVPEFEMWTALEPDIPKYDRIEITILLEATWQAKKQRNPQRYSRITR
jgi:hypothetical protein